MKSLPLGIGHIPSGVRLAALIIVAFVLGYIIRGAGPEGGTAELNGHAAAGSHRHEAAEAAPEASVEFWTCSMHPQIHQPGPGRCPICGMDLIPVSVEEGHADEGPTEITLSPHARKLAGVQVAPVERRFVATEIRMVGKVEYDESRLAYITAWVPGRLDRLFVDYTGIAVRAGDHMVSLYSPELLAAQEELIQAVRNARELERSELASTRRSASQTVEAVREKLRLWGLTGEQISAIEASGTASDHITIHAPISGIVVRKEAVEGMYVGIGTRIYTIADLSQVWVKLDAYESDLAWLRYGQEVEFQTEAYPGEILKGKIAFIDPVLDAHTRTVKVRVNVPNEDGRLKPEMFVRATVRSRVAAGGRVMEPDLAGKWICPMHPEVISNDPDSCDVCGMPLVRTEALGYVTAHAGAEEPPLVIPASAPLITGKRAVVYVQLPGREGTYEGREIALGSRAGEHYLVREGLAEGEMVVVNGNFKIDSAIQILAKPSMMSPEGGAAPAHRHGQAADGASASATHAVAPTTVPSARFDLPKAFRAQIDGVLEPYFQVHAGLSLDNLELAREGATKLLTALERVEMALLRGSAHDSWMHEQKDLQKNAQGLVDADNINDARAAFAPLSESMALISERFGTSGEQTVLRFHCPMAFDGRGADWLQNHPGTENPYFGAVMYRCGTQTGTIAPGPPEEPSPGGSQSGVEMTGTEG